MNHIVPFALQNWPLIGLAVIIILALVFIQLRHFGGAAPKLTSARATQLINQRKSRVLDIRTKEAYNKGHISGAKHYDTKDSKTWLAELAKKPEAPTLVVCAQGQTANDIANQLKKLGVKHVGVLEGGMANWQKDNLPVVKSKAETKDNPAKKTPKKAKTKNEKS